MRSRRTSALAGILLASSLVLPGLAQPQGDSVSARLGRLEEKVQSLQVMMGTLESFASPKPRASLTVEAPPQIPQAQPAQSDLGPRLDALETQISALTSHIEQIGRQMGVLEAKLSAIQAAPVPGPIPSDSEPPPLRKGAANDADEYDPSKPRWFGPKPGDEVAALLNSEGASDADTAPRDLTAALPGADAQTLYQQGYGALLQKDYVGAEATFRQLVEIYPSDPLAGDAQYWLGETYYARGQYKTAADAFLTGYQKYKSGQKAPDTLLKLGMALAELGEKDAACSTFNELKTKYPAAPAHIGDEAKAWRKKTGC